MSILVSLSRTELLEHDPCIDGLRLFDEIAELAGTPDTLTLVWTPLAAVWLAVAARGYSEWLIRRGLIPRINLSSAYLSSADLSGAYLRGADLRGADLSGADLSGADRSPTDAPIEGYTRDAATGQLRRGALPRPALALQPEVRP